MNKILYILIIGLFNIVCISCDETEIQIIKKAEVQVVEVIDSDIFNYLVQTNDVNIYVEDDTKNGIPEYMLVNINKTNDNILFQFDETNRPTIIQYNEYLIHIIKYDGYNIDIALFKNDKYQGVINNIETEINWDSLKSTTKGVSEAIESLKQDFYSLSFGISIGLKVFKPIVMLRLTKDWTELNDYLYFAVESLTKYGTVAVCIAKLKELEDGLNKNPIKTGLSSILDICIDNLYNWSKKGMYTSLSKIFVGPWDYCVSGMSNSYEIIFFSNGTFYDYIDFHTTGHYLYDFMKQTLTMSYIYVGETDSYNMGTVVYNIESIQNNEIIYSYNDKIIKMKRKSKSDYYSGEY